MKKVKSGNISIELLVGYIEETIDNSIKTEVMQWIEADPENRKYFERFEEAWKNPQDISALDKECRETDWKVISGVIEKDLSRSKKSFRSIYRWWLRAAGLLLLISSTAVAYFIGSYYSKPASLNKTGYHKIVVPKGGKSELLLSDGTTVWINAGSNIRFANRFNAETRDIWLDGEAYFDVASNKNRPFLVHTSELDVKVYGTKFNLKAYSDEDVIETTVVEGVVIIEPSGTFSGNKDEVFLKPNHKAIYLKKKAQVARKEELKRERTGPQMPSKIILTRTAQVEPSISWREGKLIFLDESFDNIALKLERRYDVKILINDEHIKKVRYTGVLKNISIEQALKAIQLTTDFNYKIDDNSIVISKKKTTMNP